MKYIQDNENYEEAKHWKKIATLKQGNMNYTITKELRKYTSCNNRIVPNSIKYTNSHSHISIAANKMVYVVVVVVVHDGK